MTRIARFIAIATVGLLGLTGVQEIIFLPGCVAAVQMKKDEKGAAKKLMKAPDYLMEKLREE